VSGCDACNPSDMLTPYLGSSASGDIGNGTAWYTGPETNRELRTELFTPPYVLDEPAAVPAVLSIDGQTNSTGVISVEYGQVLTIAWASKAGLPGGAAGSNGSSVSPGAAAGSLAGRQTANASRSENATTSVANVTSVVLMAPGSATHGWDSSQRLVLLEYERSTAGATAAGGAGGAQGQGTLAVRLPSSPAVAPPQMYMLFLVNGKTNSQAWWVHLQRPPGAGRASGGPAAATARPPAAEAGGP
jgi:hypothetical protein